MDINNVPNYIIYAVIILIAILFWAGIIKTITAITM